MLNESLVTSRNGELPKELIKKRRIKKMKNKILAIVLTAGMMTGMMATPAAVSAADVNPLVQRQQRQTMTPAFLLMQEVKTIILTQAFLSMTVFLRQAQSSMNGCSSRILQIQKRRKSQQKPHQQKMSILQVKSSVPDRMHRAYGMEVLPEHRLQYPFPGMEFIQSL